MKNKKLLSLVLFLTLLTIISFFSTCSLKGINPALAKDKATSMLIRLEIILPLNWLKKPRLSLRQPEAVLLILLS